MSAPDLSAEERATVPDPADVEKVAQAMWEEQTLTPWETTHPVRRSRWLRLAAAALTAVHPSPDSEAVARVLELADELDREGVVQWFHGPHNRNGHITARIRAAIAAPVAQAGEGR